MRQRGQPIVLVLIYLKIWSFVIERLSGVLIGVPTPRDVPLAKNPSMGTAQQRLF